MAGDQCAGRADGGAHGAGGGRARARGVRAVHGAHHHRRGRPPSPRPSGSCGSSRPSTTTTTSRTSTPTSTSPTRSWPPTRGEPTLGPHPLLPACRRHGSIERMFVLGIDPGLSRCGYGVVTRRDGLAGRGGRRGHLDRADHAPARAAPHPVRRAAGPGGRVRPGGRGGRAGLLPGQRPDGHGHRPGRRGGPGGGGRSRAARWPSTRRTRSSRPWSATASATKEQVQRMVASVLGLAEPPRPPDVADALALAACHLTTQPLRRAVAAAAEHRRRHR